MYPALNAKAAAIYYARLRQSQMHPRASATAATGQKQVCLAIRKQFKPSLLVASARPIMNRPCVTPWIAMPAMIWHVSGTIKPTARAKVRASNLESVLTPPMTIARTVSHSRRACTTRNPQISQPINASLIATVRITFGDL